MEKLNTYFGVADNDLNYAKASMPVGKQLGNYNNVASICAQSGEKFLKAVVEFCFVEDEDSMDLLHSHNLRALLNKIKTKYEVDISSRDCKWLGDFYYDTRYPGDNFVVVNEEDAQECIEIVEQIRTECFRLLASEREKRQHIRESYEEIRAFPKEE